MRIAVFLPGIMGSELWLEDEQIWPGTLAELVFRYPYVSAAEKIQPRGDELLRDDLRVGDVIRRFSVSVQYQSMIELLGRCGFRETDRTLYLCPYDWRRSNVGSADRLAEMLDEVVGGSNDQETKSIVLFGHSMGGLVARYYLESGKFNSRPAFKYISMLVCLATPHLGSPLALTASLGMERRLFLSKEQVYKLTQQPRFPSLYELLPPFPTPFLWSRELSQQLKPINIYDPQIFPKIHGYDLPKTRLNPVNLQSAYDFHHQLDFKRRPDHVRYFFFAGTRQVTATESFAQTRDNDFEIKNHEVENGGDGTVPFWSASVTGHQVSAVGGEHATIYKNGDLQQTLLAVLGIRALLAARAPSPPELSIRDRVVDLGGTFHAALAFVNGVGEVKGRISVERLMHEKEEVYGSPDSSVELSYRGVRTEQFNLLLQAPEIPGVYRIRFSEELTGASEAVDYVFVQSTIPKAEIPD